MSRLQYIATAEHVTIEPTVLNTLITTSNGDLRRAITYLQSASRLSSATTPPIPITSTDIQEIAGVVPDPIINTFVRTLGIDVEDMHVDTDSRSKNGFDAVQQAVKELVRQGFSATQVLIQVRAITLIQTILIFPQLHDLIVLHPSMSGRQKSISALIMAEADKALCDGADEELWLLEVALKIHKAMS